MIKAVLFDTIGTTVKEENSFTISKCFVNAFAENSIHIEESDFYQFRGLDKKTAIKKLLAKYDHPVDLGKTILHSFEKILDSSIDKFSEMEHVDEIFIYLKDNSIQIGIGTGLPGDFFSKVFNYLGWKKYSFDYVGISDNIGKSRPDPAMIIDMLKKLGIDNKKQVLKVGDTVADIQEGKNAGVYTAALLSGTQKIPDIENAAPDFIINSLLELKEVIRQLK
jgi:HAD superfamily hydrolase (TIGR01549 family)